MNNFIISLLLLSILPGNLFAQNNEPNVNAIKDKMKIFAPWVGKWQGESSMIMGPGEPKKSQVSESLEYKLDGMIFTMEGIGKVNIPSTKEELVVHHAFGILSYDHFSNQYKLQTYLKNGRGGEGWFKVLAENTYQWGFDSPQRKTRYTITIDPVKNTWNETGESSTDGTTWTKFFEMMLMKK